MTTQVTTALESSIHRSSTPAKNSPMVTASEAGVEHLQKPKKLKTYENHHHL